MRHGKHYANGAYHNAANNSKETQVSFLVCTACRSPNLMLSQSSQGVSWNGSGAEAQNPRGDRKEGEAASGLCSSQARALRQFQ